MGSIYYHGTNEENARSILKNGFKEGTYFTWDLHAALVMGGMWIFGIYLEDKSPEKSYWEWRNSEIIPPTKILYLRKFNIDCIYDNEKEKEKIKIIHHKERYGENIIHCKKCKGRGQTNKIPEYGRLRDNKCDVCKSCGGFGCLKKDGKRMNE